MAAYSHLPLKRVEGELLRRKNGFPGGIERQPTQHGSRIKAEISETQSEFQKLPTIDGVDPSLILKIKVAGALTDDDWKKLGLSVLSVDGDKTTVLFADDKSLSSFHQKVDAYRGVVPPGQKGPPYAQLIAAIDEVSLVEPIDRLGPTLKSHGFTSLEAFLDNEAFTLDFELHKPATQLEADMFIYRLEKVIKSVGGEINSTYSGKHLLLVRASSDGRGVKQALGLPEVALANFPPEPDLGSSDLDNETLPDFEAGKAPLADAVKIGVIDSGVNFGHKLLAPTEAGAFSVVASLGTDDEGGHGTSVASIAAFGDISARVQAKNFDAEFWIVSARVTTAGGKFPKEMSVPEIMERSIRRLHDEFGCRIINISLGDAKQVYDGARVDPWTATLDTLARELDILLVVSAGNRSDLTTTYSDKILEAYPHLLLDPASRLIAPAIGVNLLSVGAIAHSNGLDDDDKDVVGVRPICSKEEPSPFTRCGPGIRRMVKPDFVDFGGTAVWNGPTQALVNGDQKPAAGVWSFHHKPLEKAFRSRSGTSFSAPNLAYKAALLLSEFPNASANLLRALLATSARVPKAYADRTNPLKEADLSIPYGNGLASAIEAATSDDNRVVLFAEDSIKLDHFGVYEVPIPSEFQTVKGVREIKVVLAFDPPTRHTRADYLGVAMGWRLLRGTSQEEVFDRFRKWEANEGKPPEFADKFVCPTDIGSSVRERGTLQVGTYQGKTNISGYGDRYFVAVWCSRRWVDPAITEQSFALSVQLRHQNVSTLYQRVKNPIRVKLNA
ncbi:S8 family peptidase [Tianweitania sp. BSSL-BM11]|uniref:S8 family peptidase n=1 Tax=Tianweitania aestuarii TaxID=2814886 RepID=A0ABS5S1F1_9HYPH|nr:S8 family peptidase [Tianweitania aestuarii]MBS9722356.1 S8 family peptidase [Tianweitania aestuarii]